MRLLARLLCVLALPMSPLGGCNEVVGPPNTAPVAITVVTWPDAARPLEGVELCQTDTGNCVLTDADGQATLQLPFDVETSFTRTKKDFASYVLPAVIPASGTAYFLPTINEERLATQLGKIDSQYPMRGTGIVILGTFPRLAGATIELSDATGTTFYTDENLNWSLELEATTQRAGGGVVEVAPGPEYRLEFGGSANGCIPVRGWPSPFENSVRFPVREGFLTDLRVACPD